MTEVVEADKLKQIISKIESIEADVGVRTSGKRLVSLVYRVTGPTSPSPSASPRDGAGSRSTKISRVTCHPSWLGATSPA